ncbi:MAG: hypothetical protein HON94_07370 [Methylococcales bacterium]|jgi:hypothetical protein|nr:hypothetical protein [Methylococcales bacterium]MBT7410145.1 hypothetical protein [Methylococcales bacterium]
MSKNLSWFSKKIVDWLLKEPDFAGTPMCDIDRMRFELKPGDVVLVEGRSRISEVIKVITQTSWTHACLYIGRIYDIEDPDLRHRVLSFYHGDPNEQLIVEAMLGQGTIVESITKYRADHLRICRPKGLSPKDGQNVIAYCVDQLGTQYDLRQILDLARFLFPWTILPRRWRSSLFQHNAGKPTRTVCSSMIAEAFTTVNYPILPFVEKKDDGTVRLFKRNPKLFSPKDFDYSPYFDIIKYPYLGIDDYSIYRELPWSQDGVIYNDEKERFTPDKQVTTQN